MCTKQNGVIISKSHARNVVELGPHIIDDNVDRSVMFRKELRFAFHSIGSGQRPIARVKYDRICVQARTAYV